MTIPEIKNPPEQSFFSFCKDFRGKRIYTKNGIEIPKYILYWKGYTPTQIKSVLTIKDR